MGFHRSIEARERELIDNKTTEGCYHVRSFLKTVFGFAEHEDNCSYGLGYKLTLQWNCDNHILGHSTGANDGANVVLAGRIPIDDMSLYVPHYTPNISNQKIMLGHFVYKVATHLSYIERSSYMKYVTTDNIWTCELGVGDGIDIPI